MKNSLRSIYHRSRYVYYKNTKKYITSFFTGQIPFLFQNIGLARELKPAFISTMTKSGTWYNREFFYFYNQLLAGKKSRVILDNMISNKIKIPSLIKSDFTKTGYDAFFISHWVCPGFESYNGKYSKEWNKLKFYSIYTYPSSISQIPSYLTPSMIRKRYNIYYNWDPLKNKNAKNVYFYRNPLDQSISYFTGIQKMKLQSLRYRTNSRGEKEKINNVHEFIRTVGMDMYIKHLLPFILMQVKYPDNFLIIKFENLVRNPELIFNNVLKFLNIDFNSNGRFDLFKEALRMSSK